MYTRQLRITVLTLYACILGSGLSTADEPAWASEPLTLEQATRLALENDPRLELNQARADAAGGQVEQASTRPNPVIGAEIENILGTGPFEGLDRFETRLTYSQEVLTAGKREKRMDLARKQRDLFEWERDRIQAEIEYRVRLAFEKVLLAQQSLELQEKQLKLAETSAEETARLVEAARDPQVDLSRARLAQRRRQFEVDRARRSLETARTRLAALWGVSPPPPFEVTGAINPDPTLPDFDQLKVALLESVQHQRFTGVRDIREAAFELERARAVPNFDVFGGIRYFNENDADVAFVAGIDFPWPIHDKNQGNIHSARARLRAVEHDQSSTQRELLQRLNSAFQQLQSAHEELQTIHNDLLPNAEQTLAETQEGYKRGQYTLLSVLDSRSVTFDLREAHLDALQRYIIARTEIQFLTRPTQIN